ncbi:MAG: Holliday junction resolvase RuvX [Clostridia bacterium]|nr:Holliday junction resolvase RuvX [Clostridia bacterium]
MKILAVDLGLARTGLAISDATEFLASPVGTVNERRLDRLLEKIAAVAAAQRAEMIVVGHPKNMDGSCGESAQRAAQFAEDLKIATGLPVTLWDERMTTVTAHSYLNEADVRGKKRKAVVDTVAATVILQDYLEYRRLHKQ